MKKNVIQIAGKISKIAFVGALCANSLFAHNLWVNTFESYSKKGSKNVTVGLGWGNSTPIYSSIPAQFPIEDYYLVDPKNNKIQLEKPEKSIQNVFKSEQLKIAKSNMAMQDILFKKSSLKGTYSVALHTKKGFVTKYIDTKDRQRVKRVPASKIKNVKEILSSSQNARYSKSYFTFKNWTKPKPVGHELEIIPSNDFSKLYIGDTLKLEVLYKGKPLKEGFITAKSSLSPNQNALYAKVKNGKAKVVLSNIGQWSFYITKKEKKEFDVVRKASATINIQ